MIHRPHHASSSIIECGVECLLCHVGISVRLHRGDYKNLHLRWSAISIFILDCRDRHLRSSNNKTSCHWEPRYILEQTACPPIPRSKNCSNATSIPAPHSPLSPGHQLMTSHRKHAAKASPLPFISEQSSVGLTPPHIVIRAFAQPPPLSD